MKMMEEDEFVVVAVIVNMQKLILPLKEIQRGSLYRKTA